jgi:hypothetical protein
VASFYKDNAGRVYLQGLIAGGSIGSGAAAFTLPQAYRPLSQLVFPVISGGALGRCDVLVSGDVVTYAGSSGYFSLSGISFRAL